jgi:hypothetical protein
MLAGYLDEARASRFAWGSTDCVTFAAEWFRLITGRDVYAQWRGTYSTAFGAGRQILKAGAHDLAEAGDILFGDPLKTKGLINRGDIALARNAFGIVTGAGAVYLNQEGGLIEVKRPEITMGWAV